MKVASDLLACLPVSKKRLNISALRVQKLAKTIAVKPNNRIDLSKPSHHLKLSSKSILPELLLRYVG